MGLPLRGLFLALFVLAGCTPGAEQRQQSRATVWRPVASWSGRGNTTLATFPIGAGRLRLYFATRNETAGTVGRLKVHLHSADSGRILDEPFDVVGVTSGSKEVIDEHQRFYLSVESANLDWSIRVEEGLAPAR